MVWLHINKLKNYYTQTNQKDKISIIKKIDWYLPLWSQHWRDLLLLYHLPSCSQRIVRADCSKHGNHVEHQFFEETPWWQTCKNKYLYCDSITSSLQSNGCFFKKISNNTFSVYLRLPPLVANSIWLHNIWNISSAVLQLRASNSCTGKRDMM